VVINEHGQRKTITKLEAAIKQFVNKAPQVTFAHFQLLVNLSREAEREVVTARAVNYRRGRSAIMEGIVRRFSAANQDRRRRSK